MTNRIIWLVDENPRELRTCAELLRSVLPDGVEVKEVLARKHKDDYADLLSNDDTGAFILDQKLKGTGIAQYSGTELARYIRSLKSKLPIYILTNYAKEAEEFLGSEWSVEDIVAKEDLSDEEKTHIVAARLLRHINIYHDILDEREQRYKDLLIKSGQGDLSRDELLELTEIQYQCESVVLAADTSRLKQIGDLLDEQAAIISKLANLGSASDS